MSSTKDLEIAQAKGLIPKTKARSNFAPKTALTIIFVSVFLVGAMFGIGMLASHFGTSRLLHLSVPKLPLNPVV